MNYKRFMISLVFILCFLLSIGFVSAAFYASTPYMTYNSQGFGSSADNGEVRICTGANAAGATCAQPSSATASTIVNNANGGSDYNLCIYTNDITSGRSVLIANWTWANNAACQADMNTIAGLTVTVNSIFNSVWTAQGATTSYGDGFTATNLSKNVAPYPPDLNYTIPLSDFNDTFDGTTADSRWGTPTEENGITLTQDDLVIIEGTASDDDGEAYLATNNYTNTSKDINISVEINLTDTTDSLDTDDAIQAFVDFHPTSSDTTIVCTVQNIKGAGWSIMAGNSTDYEEYTNGSLTNGASTLIMLWNATTNNLSCTFQSVKVSVTDTTLSNETDAVFRLEGFVTADTEELYLTFDNLVYDEAPLVDTDAPGITINSPENNTNLSSGTTSTTINISTDEVANCKNGTSATFAWADGSLFTTTGSTTHTFNHTGLSDGNTYGLYYKCNDSSGNLQSAATHHVFAVSSSSSSSNGGGGGSVTPDKITSEGTSFGIGTYYSKSFKVGTSTHKLKVNAIGKDYARFTITSTPQKFTLNIGESTELDLTNDGVADLVVTLTKIENRKAYFNLTLPVEEEAEEVAPTPIVKTAEEELPEIAEEELMPEITEEESMPEEKTTEQELTQEEIKKKSALGWLMPLALLLIVLGAGIILFEKHKKKE